MTRNLLSYPTTLLNKRVDIFSGSKHTLPILHIFRGQVPQPHDLRDYAPATYEENFAPAIPKKLSFLRQVKDTV